MSKIRYEEIPEFQKDLKRLLKKYPSLSHDLALAKIAAIELFHTHAINNGSVFPMPNFCSETIQICKLKKFACKSLKGRGAKSGIRVIYAFHRLTLEVDCIEIYFKGDQENEDKGRIRTYLNNRKKTHLL